MSAEVKCSLADTASLEDRLLWFNLIILFELMLIGLSNNSNKILSSDWIMQY